MSEIMSSSISSSDIFYSIDLDSSTKLDKSESPLKGPKNPKNAIPMGAPLSNLVTTAIVGVNTLTAATEAKAILSPPVIAATQNFKAIPASALSGLALLDAKGLAHAVQEGNAELIADSTLTMAGHAHGLLNAAAFSSNVATQALAPAFLAKEMVNTYQSSTLEEKFAQYAQAQKEDIKKPGKKDGIKKTGFERAQKRINKLGQDKVVKYFNANQAWLEANLKKVSEEDKENALDLLVGRVNATKLSHTAGIAINTGALVGAACANPIALLGVAACSIGRAGYDFYNQRQFISNLESLAVK